jgi:citrate lyase subunit beta / citryl-CoA lyase
MPHQQPWPRAFAYARRQADMNSRLLRSALYVPAANGRAIAKAPGLGADAVIYDLEDSVAPDAKAQAREALAAAPLAAFAVIRVNGAATAHHEEDIAAACRLGPAALLLPKAGSPEDVWAFRRLIALRRPARPIAVWAMAETPLGVLNAPGIAAALGPGGALVLGLNDLAKETGMAQVRGREPMLAVLTQAVLAARAHGASVLDGVYNTLGDPEGFAMECRQGRDFGFDGKTLIHPDQIAAANGIFAPSPEEIAEADAIIAAFDAPGSAGKGVLALGRRMVERLHLDMALALRAKADAISAAEK